LLFIGREITASISTGILQGQKLICDGNLLAKATEFVPCA